MRTNINLLRQYARKKINVGCLPKVAPGKSSGIGRSSFKEVSFSYVSSRVSVAAPTLSFNTPKHLTNLCLNENN